jgi:hypothetical protein
LLEVCVASLDAEIAMRQAESDAMSEQREDEVVYRLRTEDLSWRVLNGEMIGLDLQRSEYLATNPTGALLWEALAQGATSAGLASLLVERYAIEPEQARGDVERFLVDARERGLIA